MSEFNPPLSSSQCMLETVGFITGSGPGLSIPANTAVGAFTGGLAVMSILENFSGSNPPSTNPTYSAGYTVFGGLHSGSLLWWSQGYNPGVTSSGNPAGVQSCTGGWPFSGNASTTCLTWAGILCVYRSMVAAPVNICGAEPTNCIDIDPTGQILFVGGDVEGNWRSANYGDDWIPSNYGFTSGDQICYGDVKFSPFAANTGQAGYLYACAGKGNSTAGGFFASPDGGCTFNLINGNLEFYGGATGSPPRGNANQDADRTCNQLIAFDTVNNLIYAVTKNLGVMRSSDFGAHWNTIGMSATGFYPRCIVTNPGSPGELWVGMWDTGNGLGSIYHTTQANTIPAGTTGAPTQYWNQITGISPGTQTVACMTLVGNFLYAACSSSGIYRFNITSGSPSLNNMNSCNNGQGTGTINVDVANSIWVTIDGYASGGDHVILAGCSNGRHTGTNFTNVVQLTFPGTASPATYFDLTGNKTITLTTMPPFGMTWWKKQTGSSWQFWLGGSDSVNPQILVDPNNTQRIYLCNSGGFFRSYDGGNTWQVAVNNMPMLGVHSFGIDPVNGSHFITGGSDFTSIDVLDPTGSNDSVAGVGTVAVAGPGNVFPGSDPHREAHAISCDPVDGRVYAGLNFAYGHPSGGEVTYRPPGNLTGWTSLNLNKFSGLPATGSNAPAVTGVFAGRDNANNRFVVATCQNAGTYRYTFADGKWRKCTENDSNPLPASGNALAQIAIFTPGNNPSIIYLHDRTNGVYRSVDYGSSWTLIWSKPVTNKQCGYMDIDPNQGANLWVGTDDGLWLLNGASTGVVGQAGGPVATNVGGVFNGGCAGVAFSPSGALYALALPGTGVAQPVTTMYVNTSPGNAAVSANFSDATGGDFSIASMGIPASLLQISSTGWMWGANQERVAFYVQLTSSSNLASLSGSGTLTALVGGRSGNASLSGSGTLTATGKVAQSAQLSGSGTLTATGTKSGASAGVAPLSGLGVMTALPGLIGAATSTAQWVAGQPVLFTDVNNWFTWDIAYTIVASGRTSLGLSPDKDLILPVLAGASYEVRQVIYYDGPSGPNWQWNWSYPSDASMIMNSWYWGGSGNLLNLALPGSQNQWALTGTTGQETVMSYGTLQMGDSDGNLALQWGQRTLNPTPVTIQPYSFLMIRRIQ